MLRHQWNGQSPQHVARNRARSSFRPTVPWTIHKATKRSSTRLCSTAPPERGVVLELAVSRLRRRWRFGWRRASPVPVPPTA